jgi:hypothetical protein
VDLDRVIDIEAGPKFVIARHGCHARSHAGPAGGCDGAVERSDHRLDSDRDLGGSVEQRDPAVDLGAVFEARR